MKTWIRRTAQIGVIAAGFLLAGTAVASADGLNTDSVAPTVTSTVTQAPEVELPELPAELPAQLPALDPSVIAVPGAPELPQTPAVPGAEDITGQLPAATTQAAELPGVGTPELPQTPAVPGAGDITSQLPTDVVTDQLPATPATGLVDSVLPALG